MAALTQMAQHDRRLADVPGLLIQASTDGDADIHIAVTPPEWWAPLLGTACRKRIAYLERNLHWSPLTLAHLAAGCDEVWVPDTLWANSLREAAPTLRLAVVPPISPLRANSHVAPAKLQALKASLGIHEDSLVFLCTVDADEAPACAHVLAAWQQAFGALTNSDVALILHTPPHLAAPPLGALVDTASWMAAQPQHSAPSTVVLLDQHLNAEGIDLLRACAQVLLVAENGDGLGLRVMDAVDAGNAIVGPAMHGLEEWLGADWQGYAQPSPSQPDALAAALRDAYEHIFDDSARRMMAQWHASNHLSEAAFVQRVLAQLPQPGEQA